QEPLIEKSIKIGKKLSPPGIPTLLPSGKRDKPIFGHHRIRHEFFDIELPISRNRHYVVILGIEVACSQSIPDSHIGLVTKIANLMKAVCKLSSNLLR